MTVIWQRQENRRKHTGRYATVYDRGYLLSAQNDYTQFDPDSVDYHTKRMSPKAVAAFEDGWFDALEDGTNLLHLDLIHWAGKKMPEDRARAIVEGLGMEIVP